MTQHKLESITREDAEHIAQHMALYVNQPDVQIAQTLFRMQIVENWRIPPGARVLEIGCGQGDMTAVLAHAVGPHGHVTAVDSASPDYGSPILLGQSAAYLKETPLGARIDFRFQYDVLDIAQAFPADAFDFVILAHCSWYFASLDNLRHVLLRIRPWARHLCFSEWDMEPCQFDQVTHLLVVLIQGQIGAFNIESTRNVRTPFPRTTLMRLLQETDWAYSKEVMLDTALLQDSDWEIDDCLRSCAQEAEDLNLPPKFQELLSSQIDTLRSMAGKIKSRPLPSYAILAARMSAPVRQPDDVWKR